MLFRSLLSLVAFAALAAQSPAPEFEVASVKPVSPSGTQAYLANSSVSDTVGFSGGPGTKDPGQINYSAVNLRMLLARAYDVRRYQIVGPSWLDTEFYSIVAKVPPGTTKEQLGPMLQRLLKERFRIESHRESRPMRVYTLTVAKGGHKLPAAEPRPAPALADAGQAYDREKAQAAMEKAFNAATARARQVNAGEPSGASFHFNFPGMTVAEFARRLSQSLNEPVVDQTGLDGKYNFDLSWTSDERMVFTGGPMFMPAGPALFSSMRNQLGLNLEPGKAGMEVLVIDKAERTPTEN